MVCLRTYERKDAHEHLQASQMLAHSRLHVPYLRMVETNSKFLMFIIYDVLLRRINQL